MRIDPAGVYLELLPALPWDAEKMQVKRKAAVRLHFKVNPQPGTKWTAILFRELPEVEGLDGLLREIADEIQRCGGLQDMLDMFTTALE